MAAGPPGYHIKLKNCVFPGNMLRVNKPPKFGKGGFSAEGFTNVKLQLYVFINSAQTAIAPQGVECGDSDQGVCVYVCENPEFQDWGPRKLGTLEASDFTIDGPLEASDLAIDGASDLWIDTDF